MRTTIFNLFLILAIPAILSAQYTGGNGRGGSLATFSNAPLPVVLASFTSIVSERNIKLYWVTSSEQNNLGFDVERKNSTGSFAKIGYQQGSGNTSTNYLFEDRNLQTGKYEYRLKQIDYNGNFEYHNLSGAVEVGVPAKFNLSQNYPNPFNPVTKIDFDIPNDTKVKITIFDLAGREVATIMNEFRTAGYYTVQYDASGISSGMYFYKIMTGGENKFVMTKKLVLVK